MSGEIYPFVSPADGVARVYFFIDGDAEEARRTDDAAPFDLGGGTQGAAHPFDVAALGPGFHTVRAEIERPGLPTTTATARFFNAVDAGLYPILFSKSEDRSLPRPLAGAVVSGAIFPFLTPEAGVREVRFSLDDDQIPSHIDGSAPFDVVGGSVGAAARSVGD